MTKIAEDLSNIADACRREKDDGTYTVKTGKWLTQSNKIAELLQRAREAQEDLQFVVDLMQVTLLNRHSVVLGQHSTALSHIEQFYTGVLQGVARLSILPDMPPSGSTHTKQQHRVTELPDSWTAADGDDVDQHSREDPPCPADCTPCSVQLQPTRTPSEMTTSSEMFLKPRCIDGCGCACHARAQQPRNRSWMRGLAASVGIQYDMASWGIRRDPRCRCHGDWNVEFRSLLWLCARTLVASGNRQILVSLRAPRIIPLSDIYWAVLGQSAQTVQHQIVRGGRFYPDDQPESGHEVLVVSDIGIIVCLCISSRHR